MASSRDKKQFAAAALPSSKPPAEPKSNGEDPSNSDAKFVLVVEDDEKTLRLLGLVLQRGGFRVALAPNGVAAVNLLKRSIPDLIVMDLRMPKMDGFQLLNLLKKYQSSAAIPVVVLTGSSNPFDIDRALAVGISDYLVKPISPRKLLRKVQDLLGSVS